jgi:ribonucleoside-triphosphate reductase
MMDVAARSLDTKRRIITKLMNEGLYPYTKRYLGTFDNHFSTIGLLGMNEACLNANWLRNDLTDPDAQRFAKEVLNHMREKLSDYQEQYNALFNLEATPAESTAYRLAKHDVERYPDIITAADANGGAPYYTNSSHLPVGFTEDVFEALEIQDDLQTLYTSGTVFHAFLGEKMPDWKSAANLVRKIAENHRLPYYTLSPTYSVCKNHGYLDGEQQVCPECGEKAEIYSRITGYYRPVQNWNEGKSQEFKDRRLYDVGSSRVRLLADRDAAVSAAQAASENPAVRAGTKTYLFATATCPNCKVAGQLLDKAGIEYEKLISEDHSELARAYSIKQAPTLIIDDGISFEKHMGVSDIKKFLSAEKVG